MGPKFAIIIILATSETLLEVNGDLNDQFPDNGDRPLYNKDLFEGDILGRKSNKERSIYAYDQLQRIWPHGDIPFEIDPSLESSRPLIVQAMDQIQDMTCVKFFDRSRMLNSSQEKDYVLIKNTGAGCASHVGRAGGEQLLILGPNCLHKGHILHELAHTVGLEHEHSRSDRKYNIDIDWDNIPRDFWDKFEAADPRQENLLDEPFDLTSVMMFADQAFAMRWQKPSILPHVQVPLNPIRFKGNLSQSDINRINKIYQCSNWTLPPPIEIHDEFHCDFEHGDCGIVNQANMGTYFWMRNLQNINITKGTSLVMGYATSLAGRLLVPPQRVFSRREGCLTFEHGRFPDDVDRLQIVQEGHERRVLANIAPGERELWKKVQLDLNTTGETEIQFIFTMYVIYSPDRGPIDFEERREFVVLDNFRYSRTKCPSSNIQ